MRGRRLDAAYKALKLQLGAHDHARRTAQRSSTSAALLVELGLSDLVGEAVKDRRKVILERFEITGRQIRRQGFVDLVSSFEFDLFRSIRTATSNARHVLNSHYQAGYAFSASPGAMARTPADFANLGGYRRLLSEPSSKTSDPRRDLWSVISHRDYLAHGERWEPSAAPPDLEAAYRILSRELDAIEAAPEDRSR